MIKRLFLLGFLALSAILVLSPYAFAKDPFVKLGRGLGNTVFGFFEILRQPALMAKTERWPIALGGGIPKGALYAVARTVVGVYEAATFPIPAPQNYEPIMKPEFVIDRY